MICVKMHIYRVYISRHYHSLRDCAPNIEVVSITNQSDLHIKCGYYYGLPGCEQIAVMMKNCKNLEAALIVVVGGSFTLLVLQHDTV